LAAINRIDSTSLTPPTRHASTLATPDRVGLQQLLEDDPVRGDLAGGDPARRAGQGLRDAGVTEHVVGVGGLLDPVRVELDQPGHVGDRLVDVPDLVGVHHQQRVRADLGADEPAPRTSSSIGPPTFIFIARQPSAYAARVRARTLSSG
jgi:hypothetical protein